MEEPRLVVVGGGVAGLAGARAARAAARRLGLPLRITVLEARPRLGGKVWTETIDGLPFEWGADSLVGSKPRGRDLLEELGLSDEIVTPGKAARGAYLVLGGRLRPLPSGLVMGIPPRPSWLVAAVRAGILDVAGAARATLEPFVPRIKGPDRSVAEVMTRRLGAQVAQRLVAPLLTGVYGSPPERLSMAAALPQFRGARSLVVAARRFRQGAGDGFLALRSGMGRLVQRLEEDLTEEDLRTSTPALSLKPRGGRFLVEISGGEVEADRVLLAPPAHIAGRLLEQIAPQAGRALGQIEYSATAVVHLRYGADALARPEGGAGYLVTPGEGGLVAACSWVDVKWPHLGAAVPWLRAMVLGRPGADLEDEVLVGRVAVEVGRTLGAREMPQDVRLRRWEAGLPVYAPGHLERVAEIRRSLPDGVEVAGAALDGVGIPDCARTGEAAAERLVASLG